MVRRAERAQRKQAKLAAGARKRALRQGDALALLEVRGGERTPEEWTVVAKLLCRDLLAAHRRKDRGRVLRLGAAAAPDSALLDQLMPAADAMAARWALLGAAIERGDSLRARVFRTGLASVLGARAPDLAQWVDAAIDAGGLASLAPDTLPTLVRDTPHVQFEDVVGVCASFREVTIAASVLLNPDELTRGLSRHLEDVAADQRGADEACVLAVLRPVAFECARARDRSGLRACVGLLARLGAAPDGASGIALALRLAKQGLNPDHSREDLASILRLVRVAFDGASTQPLAVAALDGLQPVHGLGHSVLALCQHLLGHAPSAPVWAKAVAVWGDAGDDADPPRWLDDAFKGLVDDGTLCVWLVGTSGSRRLEILEAVGGFDWAACLQLVEQLWGRLPRFEQSHLAARAAECLHVSESPVRPSQPSVAGPVTVREMRNLLQRRLSSIPPGENPGRVQLMIDELEGLPPSVVVPPEVVDAMFCAWNDDAITDLGPRQQAFIARMGLRVVCHSMDILHTVLHDPSIRADAGRWLDARLGSTPSADELTEVALMIWDQDWVEPDTYIRERVEVFAARSGENLAAIFLSLSRVYTGCPPDVIKRLATDLCAAVACGTLQADNLDPAMLEYAELFAHGRRRRRKKAASKKTASKKTASKKTVSKKAASKKTASKKTASKKTASKKTASKKTASKKTVSKKAASKKTVSKKAASKKTVSKKTASKKTATKKTRKSAASDGADAVVGPEQLLLEVGP